MLLTPPPVDAARREQVREQLRGMRDKGHLSWSHLLDTARDHCCSSLLFARLAEKNFLDLVPAEPREVLKSRFRHNLVRDMIFRFELVGLLNELAKADITVILLKGAATWIDNLYGPDGAREMSDIDILVRAADIERAAVIIETLGYSQIPNPNMVLEGLPTDRRHHHLRAFGKPGSPVFVELHYRLGYGRTGGIASEEELWQNSLAGTLEGVEVRVLNPTYRLIHNTAHGMVPECEFISSRVSLRQLAEFVYLAARYRREIDWRTWRDKGVQGGMNMEFFTWLHLAGVLFGLEYPQAVPFSPRARLHAARILQADRLQTGRSGVKDSLIWLLIRLYYYLSLPGWVWENVCYTEGGGHNLARMIYMAKKAASPRSRAKIG